jgi:hypothetical protein
MLLLFSKLQKFLISVVNDVEIWWKFPCRNLTTVIKNINKLDKHAKNRMNEYTLQYYNINQ